MFENFKVLMNIIIKANTVKYMRNKLLTIRVHLSQVFFYSYYCS